MHSIDDFQTETTYIFTGERREFLGLSSASLNNSPKVWHASFQEAVLEQNNSSFFTSSKKHCEVIG